MRVGRCLSSKRSEISSCLVNQTFKKSRFFLATLVKNDSDVSFNTLLTRELVSHEPNYAILDFRQVTHCRKELDRQAFAT